MVDIDPAELAEVRRLTCRRRSVPTPARSCGRCSLADQRSGTHTTARPGAAVRRLEDALPGGPARAPQAEGPVSIYHFAEVMSDELRHRRLIVSGSSGSGIELFLLALRVKDGQRIFHTHGLGAMGYGMPAAIGACLARRAARTVCVDGDGGFQFNIQELETVARLQLPIKFFVLNNDGYASIRASQTAYFGEPDRLRRRTGPDRCRTSASVARAYGLPPTVIADQSDLPGRDRARARHARAGGLRRHVIPDEIRMPRLSSVQRPDGSFVSKPLEDLWPFLDRDEFRANMLVPVPRTDMPRIGIMQGRLVPSAGRLDSVLSARSLARRVRPGRRGRHRCDRMDRRRVRRGRQSAAQPTPASRKCERCPAEHGVAVVSLCADYFLDRPIVRASPAGVADLTARLELAHRRAVAWPASLAWCCRSSTPPASTHRPTSSASSMSWRASVEPVRNGYRTPPGDRPGSARLLRRARQDSGPVGSRQLRLGEQRVARV